MVDLVTNYGAVNDGQYYTAAVLTIAAGSKNLSCSTPIFTGSAMVTGKTIRVGYLLSSPATGGSLATTIDTVTDSTHIVLHDPYPYALAGVACYIAWGTDNTFAINAFNTAPANVGASNVVLTAPAGNFYFHGNGILGSGVRSMTFTGAGVGSTNIIGALYYGSVGGVQIAGDAAARVLDVAPGATTATLMNAGDASRFTGLTPCWCMLASVDMQGVTSDPPNNALWDYVRVLSVAGTLVTFDRAVVNLHKSTYPLYDPGVGSLGSGASCKGGPATLYILYPSWDIDATFQNFSMINDPNRSSNCNGRIITISNCSGPNGGPQASVQMQLTLNNCNFPNYSAEIDKEIETAIVTNSTFDTIFMQSASPKNLSISGTTVLRYFQGGGVNVVSSNNIIGTELGVGVGGYGASNSWSSTNDSFQTVKPGGCLIPDVSIYGLQNGKISYPLTKEPIRWAVPGARVFFSGSNDNEDNVFVVTDLSTDGNAVYATITTSSGNTVLTSTTALWSAADQGKPIRISTNALGTLVTTTIAGYTSPTQITLAAPTSSPLSSVANTYVVWGSAYVHTDRLGSSWPSLPTTGGGLLGLQGAPVNRATFVNCIGCVDATDLSRAPANSALHSYSNRTYAATGELNWGSGAIGPQPAFRLWGAFRSVKVTVTKAYTGAQSECRLTVLARNMQVQQLDGSMVIWPIYIDLKQGVRTVTFTPGARSIAPTASDSFPIMSYGWFPGYLTPYLETNISGDADHGTWPTVTIEIVTDQGITASSVAPLRLRLHA